MPSIFSEAQHVTHGEAPGSITAAEESTALRREPAGAPGRPGLHLGGNMGWMHDILDYTEQDPVHRRWAHNLVTFSMLYA